MSMAIYFWKRKQAVAFVALGVLFAVLAVLTEPGLVVYVLPGQEAALEASHVAKYFRTTVFIIGVLVALGGSLGLLTKRKN